MHIYEKDGLYLPSVTTILHSVIIDGDRLLNWSNSLGFRHIKYADELNRSADFGTAVHTALEQIMTDGNGAKITLNGFEVIKFKKVINNFMSFIDQNNITPHDTLHAELTLGSIDLGYAGTCDWVGYVHDKLTLIDYKTAKKPNDSMYMQISAYMHLLRESGINIDQAGILTVGEKECKLYMKTLDELEEYYETFEIIHSLFNRITPYSKLEEEAKQLNNLITCERND